MTILVHSEDFVREAMTFVRDETGGASASGNGYDDRIMAGLIGLFIMHQTIEAEPSETLEPRLESRGIIVPKSYFIDAEFSKLLEYGKYGDYEQSWLNY